LLVVYRLGGENLTIHESLKFARKLGCLGAESEFHMATLRIVNQFEEKV
jgi:hypothetical protein